MSEKRDDAAFIRECIAMARDSRAQGDEPFSAMLVVDGQSVLSATNRVLRERDRTQHAELIVVQGALRQLDESVLARSTLYASTEPCIMCAAAIYWARIPRVVFGCSQEAFVQATGCGFSMACREVFAIGARTTEVVGPLLEEEALAVHRA